MFIVTGILAALTVEERVARGLILVPERRELFAAMSVADNLELGGFQRARSGERGWRDTQHEMQIFRIEPRKQRHTARDFLNIDHGVRQWLMSSQ